MVTGKIDVLKDKAKRHKKGGQSQNRFQKLDDEAEHNFLKRLSDHVNEYFGQYPDLEAIMIGGPTEIKNRFIDQYLDKKYKDKVIFVVDTGNGGELGLRDLMQKAKDQHVLENHEYMKEEEIVDDFMDHVAKNDGLAEYGKDNVKEKIEARMVGALLLSESLDHETIDEMLDLIKSTGSKAVSISTVTEKGKMFSSFGGVGAILRWRDNNV